MKSSRGFTLIEILVVIAITGVMFAFLVVNFQGNQNVRDIKSDGLLLLDGIKRMQTMALAGSNSAGRSPVYYEFLANVCPLTGCSYSLTGHYLNSTPPPVEEIEQIATVNLKNSKLSVEGGFNNILIDFNMPRAAVIIKVNSVGGVGGVVMPNTTIKLVHVKDSNAFIYVKINAISGRMDISNTP